jgi:gamma-glutamyl-gamma-aminobutyrate hydrolase PuuD
VIIGLSQRVLFHKDRAHDSLEHGWYRLLEEHALCPIPNFDRNFDQLAKDLDVLILTGGDDTTIRRITELKIATAMMKLGKPILGVCHGAFVLTSVLGGKVAQCDGHMDTEHFVTYRRKKIKVNSFHSNQIVEIPEEAISLAEDADGHCEAWISKNVGAIVWHPERMEEPFIPTEIMEFLNDKRKT